MLLSAFALVWAAASLAASALAIPMSIDELQEQANANILASLDKRHEELTRRGQPSPCNRDTVAIRKE
jgi:hypothetical protein